MGVFLGEEPPRNTMRVHCSAMLCNAIVHGAAKSIPIAVSACAALLTCPLAAPLSGEGAL